MKPVERNETVTAIIVTWNSGARLREIRQHLRKHAGLGRVLMVTAAFIADSAQEDASLASRVLRCAVDSYRKCRLMMARAGLGLPFKELYGMEVYTNRVKKHAELWLPWDGDRAPRKLLISGEWDGEIAAEINGSSLLAPTTHSTERRCVFVLPRRVRDHRLLRVDLRQRQRGSSRLATAHLW